MFVLFHFIKIMTQVKEKVSKQLYQNGCRKLAMEKLINILIQGPLMALTSGPVFQTKS